MGWAVRRPAWQFACPRRPPAGRGPACAIREWPVSAAFPAHRRRAVLLQSKRSPGRHRNRQSQGRQRQEHARHAPGRALRQRGLPVMLGDVDRQQSTQIWLRLRGRGHCLRGTPIVGWAVDPKRVLRPPAGVSRRAGHAGRPARLRPGAGRRLRRRRRHAGLQFRVRPRVGGRMPRRADGAAAGRQRPLQGGGGRHADRRAHQGREALALGRALELPFVGVLREAQAYVRCIEQGLTCSTCRHRRPRRHREWAPILEWLEPALRAVHRPEIRANPGVVRQVAAPAPCREALPAPGRSGASVRLAGLFGWLAPHRLLQRQP